MKLTRILGIAPYEGMRNLMTQLASSMEDVDLTALVGDLAPGAALLDQYNEGDFDVILSRGGTAEIIRKKTSLPVVDIELSIYDILRTIRLAQSSNNHFALVGFPAITRNAFFLCDVLRFNIDLYTIHNESEAREVLKKLAAEKCTMVLCDMITNSLAHEYGLPALLIISGSESIEAAIRQAVSLNQIFQPLRAHTRLLNTLLSTQTSQLIVLGENGEERYRSTAETPCPALQKKMQELYSSILAEGSRRLAITAEGQSYNLQAQSISIDGECYAVFSIQPHAARQSMEKYGIRFLNKEEVLDRFFNSFYGITQPGDAQRFNRYDQNAKPVMIAGELGTGKDQMARLLYGSGSYQNTPICMIDCALLQQKGWNYLMNHEDSPLTASGITVHFRHTKDLLDDQFVQLFSMLKDLHYHRRNQLIFTYSLSDDSSTASRAQQLICWFDCDVIHLPLLRSHQEDIPHLASLYISNLNMHNAKEIVGVEPEGMVLLQSYEWPNNYDQFKRVLKELVQTVDGSYITRENVHTQLIKERLLYPCVKSQSMAELFEGKSLEEINLLAMRHVLAQEHGNRTTTAAKLGISRTSLWRMMQKCGLPEEAAAVPEADSRPKEP
ncbi:MAG: PrpR N-terminal domain-containing protein [Clostridia bacterium]